MDRPSMAAPPPVAQGLHIESLRLARSLRDRLIGRRAAAQRRRTRLPVMSHASSDARYPMTRATSSGSTMWTRSELSSTFCLTSSVTHPVSVTGGYTTFAVIPRCANSNARGHRVVF